ncbi:hypothetical protein BGX30_004870, partial [Mortierella sp. GBA39]
MSFSKPSHGVTFLTDKLDLIGKNEGTPAKLVGHDRLLCTIPELYDILLKRIPSGKIHMSKRVLSFEQNHEGVTVHFSDNTLMHGDILVGADGAHSAVHQHLYKTLTKEVFLPKTDKFGMSKGYISLLGTTDPLDLAKFTEVLNSKDYFVVGDKDTPYTNLLECRCSVEHHRNCRRAVQLLGLGSSAEPENDGSIRHFVTPYGALGIPFDTTTIECVSKVYLEDMLFETWNHGRMLRTSSFRSGAGAVNAMQDAVLLANHIYDIKPTSFGNIKTALSDYKNERFEAIKDQYPQSHISAKLIFGH